MMRQQEEDYELALALDKVKELKKYGDGRHSYNIFYCTLFYQG